MVWRSFEGSASLALANREKSIQSRARMQPRDSRQSLVLNADFGATVPCGLVLVMTDPEESKRDAMDVTR